MQPLESFRRRTLWPAWIVLGASLLATLGAWVLADAAVREDARTRFQALAANVALQISTRVTAYEQVLRGGVSLFQTLGSVSRAQWHSYVEGLQIGKNYPGIQGIGYAVVVRSADVARHTAAVRAEGFPSYEIHPAGDRPVYTAIVYLEPFNWRNQRAFGFDMLSEPVRRQAMERARDTGEAATSGKVTLVQETETDVQSGFLMYLPLFDGAGTPPSEEARRDHLVGFVYAPFRAGDFIHAIPGAMSDLLRLQVFDGDGTQPGALMFDSLPDAEEDSGIVPPEVVALPLPGHQWTLRFLPLPAFALTIDRNPPRLVPAGGTVIGTLLFLVVWSFGRSNEQLRRKEADFRYLFEKNPSVMWIYDHDSYRFLEVNEAAVALYGWSREEFLSMTIMDIRPPEDVPRLVEVIRALPEGLRHSGEWRHRTRDGRELIVDMVSYAFVFGGRRACLVVVRDMTQYRRAQAALAESEERFRTMADSMPALLWVDDAAGNTIFVNKPWLDYTGRPLSAELGEGWIESVHPEDRDLLTHAYGAAVEARAPFEVQYRLRQADGAYRWFLDRGTPRFAADGAFLGFIGVLLDITELRNARAQLEQAQKMETVGRLTGGVAHDFNNLLTVIIGNAEILSDELAGDVRLGKAARVVLAAAERGAELTRRMLAFARRQQLQPRLIDMRALVEGLEGMLRRTLGEDIEVEVHGREGLWPTVADPVQLESAILNLAINARDAMPAGGKLTIGMENVHLDADYAARNAEVAVGDYVMLAVSDTGTGMAPDVLERAFEPFFTTKEVGKGSGLGLSTVYGFVKQSGGHVKAYSEVGHGTTVRIYLPRAGATRAEAVAAEASAQPAPTGGEAILVVEDDPAVRAQAEDQLRTLGYRVIGAADGPAALALLAAHPEIDLLFTDVIMPGGLNGRQLAEEAVRLRPGLKVLFTSGYAEDAILHHGRLPRGVNLLNKPYRRQDLAVKVRSVLDS
ncbi:MAG: CHASE domain-containing protein [Rhodospirillaceae bacterium]|nr:CHASE domain-containing protein [Rhodospirillaceae bacterium]